LLVSRLAVADRLEDVGEDVHLLLVVTEADDRFLADSAVGGHEARRKRLFAGLVVPRKHQLLLLVPVHRLVQLEHHRFRFALLLGAGGAGLLQWRQASDADRRGGRADHADEIAASQNWLGDRAGFALGAGRGLVGGHH